MLYPYICLTKVTYTMLVYYMYSVLLISRLLEATLGHYICLTMSYINLLHTRFLVDFVIVLL